MLKRGVARPVGPNHLLLQIVAGCCFGILLGISCLKLSPLVTIEILIAIALGYAVLKRPEIGLLCILVITSSIVFEDALPLIPVGGVSLNVPDIFLIGLLSLIIVRALIEPGFRIIRTPLDWPLLIFLALTLLITLAAIYKSSVDAEIARRDIRVLSYYLTFFIVTNQVRNRQQLNFLINGLIILASIVAFVMILQFLLGDSVQLIPGRVETLQTQGVVFSDITRILPPGWPIVLVSFVIILCMLVFEKPKYSGFLKYLLFGLFGLALLVTFLRSYWAVLLMVFLTLAYLLKGHDRHRLFKLGVVMAGLVSMIILLLLMDPDSRASRLVSASINRLNSLTEGETYLGGDSSLNWRAIENGYAISTISANPLIGLGMGARYRPWDRRLDLPVSDYSGYDFRRHIHNGHLWILLQSGLLGYLSLVCLSFAFLIRGFRLWRRVVDNRMRAIVLGFTLVYMAVFVAAVVNSTFMQWNWIPVIGIIMGINEVIQRIDGQAASTA